MNRLSLVFGNSTASASATLAIFMAGIFFGSFLMKKRAGNYTNALFIYGLLEIGIGLSALLFLVFLSPVQQLYNFFYDAIVFKPFILFILRFGLAGFFLLLPTLCMGATVPIFTIALMRRARLSHGFSWVYFLNSLGGAIGVVMAGFYFFEHLGFKGTYGLAFGINLLAGVSAIFMAKRYEEQRITGYSIPRSSQKQRLPAGINNLYPSWLLYALFFATGLISFAMEILCFRFCALFFGSSTYSFSSVLFVVILGIALGALIASKTSDEKKTALFPWSLVLLGCSLILTFPLINLWPQYIFSTYSLVSHSFYAQVVRNLLYAVLFMGLPALSFGLIFPLALFCLERSKATASDSHSAADTESTNDFQVGRSVSLAYAVNTLGCVSGSLVTGFLLLKALGSQNSYILFTGLAVLLSVPVLIYSGKRRKIWCGLVLVLCIGAGLTFEGINKSLLQAGLFRNAELYTDFIDKHGYKKWVKTLEEKDKLIFFEEGIAATINVISQPGDNKVLKINGKPDGSTWVSDRESFLLMGLAPYLIRSDYKRAGIVGLGTGLTAAVVYELGADQIDVMELSQGVINAQPYFAEVNNGVDARKNVHLIVEDGRNYLQGTKNSYDLIISQPSNPWIQGVASLFTSEFYQIVKSRLNQGGIFVQWIQTYETTGEIYQSLIKTLHQNFPYILLFKASPADVLLIASQEEEILKPECLSSVLKSKPIQKRLSELGLNSAIAILRNYLGGITPEMIFGPEIKLHTDDNLFIQYEAPKLLGSEKELVVAAGEREEIIKDIPAAFFQRYRDRVLKIKQIARKQHNPEKETDPEKERLIREALDKLKEEDRKLLSIFNNYGVLRRKFQKQGIEIYQNELSKFVKANPFFFDARRDCMYVSLRRGDVKAVCDNLELFYRTSQDLKTSLLFVGAALKGAKEKKITVTQENKESFKDFIDMVKKSVSLSPEEKIRINQIEKIL